MAKKRAPPTGKELERIIAKARPAKPPSKTAPQFVLRYTPELRDKIARLAKANGRSINSELRLTQT